MKHIFLFTVVLLLSQWSHANAILSGKLPAAKGVSYQLYLKEVRTTQGLHPPIELQISTDSKKRYRFSIPIERPTFFNLSIVVEKTSGAKTNSNTVLYLLPGQHLKLPFLSKDGSTISPNYQKVNNTDNKPLIEVQQRLIDLNRTLYNKKFDFKHTKATLHEFYNVSDSILHRHNIQYEVKKYIEFYAFDQYNAALYRSGMELAKIENVDTDMYYRQPKDPLLFFNDPMLLSFYTGISNIINYLDLVSGMKPYSQRKSLEQIGLQYRNLDNAITNKEVKDQVLDRLLSNYVTRYRAGGSFDQDFDNYKNIAANIKDGELRTQNTKAFENLRYTLPGADWPSIPLHNSAGDTVLLDRFKGKYILIDLWASWCVPCIKMMPHLQALEKEYVDKDIVFIALSIDADRSKWLHKINELHLEGHQLLDQKGEFAKLLNVTGIPHYMLYDPHGKLVQYRTAMPDSPQIKELLDTVLKTNL